MRKVVVFTNMTLDGVIQGPARPDEDQSGGFRYGGWAEPYNAMQEAGDSAPGFGALLVGRRNYQGLYSHWTKQKNNPFTESLTKMPKYVVSTTLKEPLPWENSTLIKGNLAEAVNALKAQDGNDIVVMGSGKLTQSLMNEHLIDRFVLMIHPVVLGTGERLFDNLDQMASLKLVSSKQTPHGVVVTVYEPAK